MTIFDKKSEVSVEMNEEMGEDILGQTIEEEMGTVHELKLWPVYYEAVESGLKTYEIRYNDRNFKVGDILHLKEYDPDKKEYTGREILKDVIYITEGFVGLAQGFVVLGLGLSLDLEN